MLLIQEKLRSGHSLESLSKEHGLNLAYHKELPLVIVNYDQIESKKTDKLACQCRGLILELNTWNIVASSFNRFFNYGEMIEEQKSFNWNSFSALEKIDGSLMLLWCYRNKWYCSTRGSFADQKPNGAPYTWEEMFWSVFKCDLGELNTKLTYVFEFVSPYTKIVREYKNVDIYLLTIIDNNKERPVEISKNDCLFYDFFSQKVLRVKKPELYHFKSPTEILEWLNQNGETDPTFEGFVVRDDSNNRIKLKSQQYVSLHHLRGNGNIFSYKYLIPFAFNGESEELLLYFPECKDILFSLQNKVKKLIDEAMLVWESSKNEEYQKNFALSIKGRTLLGSVLFEARKLGVCPSTLFKNYQDLFLKIIKE